VDTEETRKQENRIRELQEVVAKGLKGINLCRYREDCPFARHCPAIC
jgi:hypothetical protein